MSTKLSPKEAVPFLQQRWAEMSQSRFDVAVLQNGTELADCPSLRAWRAGDRDRAIQLLLSDEHLAAGGLKDFLDSTHQKSAAGITMIRVHLMDEERYAQDVNCHHYLDWLREHFCRINTRFGSEEIHWLPKSVCDKAGIALPPDDTALYDNERLITSQYTYTGGPISRTFYELVTDQAEIEQARELIAQVTELIAGDKYRLQPATEPVVAID